MTRSGTGETDLNLSVFIALTVGLVFGSALGIVAGFCIVMRVLRKRLAPTVDPTALLDAFHRAGDLRIVNQLQLANAVLMIESQTKRTLH